MRCEICAQRGHKTSTKKPAKQGFLTKIECTRGHMLGICGQGMSAEPTSNDLFTPIVQDQCDSCDGKFSCYTTGFHAWMQLIAAT